MANVRSGNTFYIDTAHSTSADDLLVKNIRAMYVVVTATSANAAVVLADASTSDKKCDLRIATSGNSQLFRFDNAPIVFANGIKVTTLTNAIATIVVDESRG